MLCYGAITPELSIMRKTTVEAGWIDLGSGWDPRSLRKTGDGAWASLISEMKNCLLKMGGMIVDFLEEVSDRRKLSSIPYLTRRLASSLQALEHSTHCCSPFCSRVGWRLGSVF